MQVKLSLSIVSHGQGELIRALLDDLSHGLDMSCEILITLNIPEDEAYLERHGHLTMCVIRNAEPKGFGANHNAAFQQSCGAYFAVVNPDVRLPDRILQPLIDVLSSERAGVSGPIVLSPAGAIEDNARRFPKLLALVRRRLSRRRTPDYCWKDEPIEVDWLAGMFLLFDRTAYTRVGGFDERYYMYLEDADICWRLKTLGYSSILQPLASIVHDARRASRKDLTHFRWHLSSIVRFLAYRFIDKRRTKGD